MLIYTFKLSGGTGSSSVSLLKGRLINTNFFPLAWLWRQGHSQNAWMLPWPPWGSRAFVYSITWMISSFWPTSGNQWAITGMLSSTTFMLLVSEQTPRRVFSPTLNKLCFCEFTWIPFKYRPVWLLPGFPASMLVQPHLCCPWGYSTWGRSSGG